MSKIYGLNLIFNSNLKRRRGLAVDDPQSVKVAIPSRTFPGVPETISKAEEVVGEAVDGQGARGHDSVGGIAVALVGEDGHQDLKARTVPVGSGSRNGWWS